MKNFLIFSCIFLFFVFGFFVRADDEYYYDVAMESITVIPSSPAAGQEVMIVAKGKNTGNKNIYFSDGFLNYEYDFADFNRGSSTIPNPTVQSPIPPGSSFNFVFSGSFDEPGYKDLSFDFNFFERHQEKTIENNSTSKRISVASPEELDLEVSRIDFSEDEIIVGNSVDIDVIVKNNGKFSLIDGRGLFGDNNIESLFNWFDLKSSTLEDVPNISNPFDPGEELKYSYSGYFTRSGDVNLSFRIDKNNNVSELNENNNFLSTSTYVYKNQEERDDFEIYNLDYELVSTSSVKIKWETSKEATSKVDYRVKYYYGDTSRGGGSGKSFSHEILLEDLAKDVPYYYKVISTNNTVTKESQYYEFITPAEDGPTFTLSPDMSFDAQSKEAVVTWMTDILTKPTVYYKNFNESEYHRKSSDQLLDKHFVNLGKLDSGIYRYYIVSKDYYNREYTSETYSFVISSEKDKEDDPVDVVEVIDVDNSQVENQETSDEVTVEEIDIKNNNLYNTLKGRIILKVESSGEAYYIDPKNQKMYYLGRPDDAFRVMREQGVGITNNNLNKICIGLSDLSGKDSDSDGLSDMFEDAIGTNKDKDDTDQDGFKDRSEIETGYNPNGSGSFQCDRNFSNSQKGKIFLQVESHGEAWYVNPKDGKRYFLGRAADAFQVMRTLGLGISNENFSNL